MPDGGSTLNEQSSGANRTKRLEADSRRGRPDFHLRRYAAARNLRVVEPGGPYPAGFSGALNLADDRQMNVMVGELPGGAAGLLFHEPVVVEVSAATRTWSHDIGAPGNYTASSSKRLSVKDVLALILTFGLFAAEEHSPTLRMPFTTAVTRVPEATGVVPRFRIDSRKRFPPYRFGDPEPLASLPGWLLSHSELSDRATLERFVEGPVGELLSGHAASPLRHGELQVVFWCGQLMVRTLGYLSDHRELDALGSALSTAATELERACASASRPIPFAQELPQVRGDDRTRPAGDVIAREQSGFDPPQGHPWHQRIRELAARYSLRHEDPRAYHLAFPSLEIPGQAFAVLRGPLAGAGSAPARIAVHAERPLWTGDVGVNAVLLAANDRAQQTPPGGVPLVERGMRFAVRDGVYAAWRNRSADHGDFEALVADALGVARDRELVSFGS